MLAAGQYGAMFFAGYPHRMDRFMGFLPIACPCKDADIPRLGSLLQPALGPVFFRGRGTGGYRWSADGETSPTFVIPALSRDPQPSAAS